MGKWAPIGRQLDDQLLAAREALKQSAKPS
jgi:hypothetical protein